MMRGFPPRAPFRLPNFATWRNGPAGEISVTKDSGSRGRRSGWPGRQWLEMKMLTTIAETQAQRRGKRRLLVPTMGALHKAHGELIRVARERAGKDGEVAVSIFVNPLQFEPGGDYQQYPRPEKADEEFCRAAGVDLLFRPSVDEMYLADRSTFVEETSLATTLEGKARPSHFRGVCTVVAKLLHILAP